MILSPLALHPITNLIISSIVGNFLLFSVNFLFLSSLFTKKYKTKGKVTPVLWHVQPQYINVAKRRTENVGKYILLMPTAGNVIIYCALPSSQLQTYIFLQFAGITMVKFIFCAVQVLQLQTHYFILLTIDASGELSEEMIIFWSTAPPSGN